MTRQRIGTIHIVCGLPGTGKTMFAKRLEQEVNGVYLNHDAWIVGIFGENASDKFDKYTPIVWNLFWKEIISRLLSLGIDVILDFGLWYRSEREDIKRRAEALNAPMKLYFVQCSPKLQWERVRQRNFCSGSIVLTQDMLAEARERFEEPGQEENPIFIDTGG